MALQHDIRRAAELLRPERWRYAAGLGALLGVNVSDVIAPLFLAVAVELAESQLAGTLPSTPPPLALVGLETQMFGIVAAVAVYLGLQVVANILRYPMLMWTAVPSHRITQGVRRSITNQLLAQSQPFYDSAKSGDLMSIATADVNAIRMMLGPAILVGADTLMLVSLVLCVMFLLSWQLALVTLIPLPIIYFVTNRLTHMEYKGFEAVQADLSEMTERVRESYAGIRIIQGYAREAFDRDRFRDYSLRHYTKNLVLARVRAAFDPTLDFMLGVSNVLVLVFGGIWVASGQIAVGTFVAFLFLVRYLAGPMIGFGWSISLVQRGRASLERLRVLLEAPIEIYDEPDAAPIDAQGRIEVRDLTFEYAAKADEPGVRPGLHRVSLTVEPGESLGVFGPVGAGKTTLARLLTRLYEPPRGTVFLDGVDVRDITLDSLREQIVLAPQETFLFSSTVERNVALALESVPSRAEIEQFSRLAHLHDEVLGFDAGYETMLGERGVNLSGGQRQRLAIARAIAADPRVLILDDCLSAVDAQTEDAILRSLRTVFAGRTGILVSHRIRAVRDCDKIVVVEAGVVTGYGTHAELLEAGGYYAQIATQQLRQEEEDVAAQDAS